MPNKNRIVVKAVCFHRINHQTEVIAQSMLSDRYGTCTFVVQKKGSWYMVANILDITNEEFDGSSYIGMIGIDITAIAHRNILYPAITGRYDYSQVINKVDEVLILITAEDYRILTHTNLHRPILGMYPQYPAHQSQYGYVQEPMVRASDIQNRNPFINGVSDNGKEFADIGKVILGSGSKTVNVYQDPNHPSNIRYDNATNMVSLGDILSPHSNRNRTHGAPKHPSEIKPGNG